MNSSLLASLRDITKCNVVLSSTWKQSSSAMEEGGLRVAIRLKRIQLNSKNGKGGCLVVSFADSYRVKPEGSEYDELNIRNPRVTCFASARAATETSCQS